MRLIFGRSGLQAAFEKARPSSAPTSFKRGLKTGFTPWDAGGTPALLRWDAPFALTEFTLIIRKADIDRAFTALKEYLWR